MMLFVKQYDNEQAMQTYNALHKLEANGIYSYDKPHSDGDPKLAKYIHTNYNTMDETEIKNIAIQCMDINDAKHILLDYELTHYKDTPKIMTLDEFSKTALTILNRFQGKAGGFLIEDLQWTLYTTTTKKYEIHSNEILFENTLNICDYDDHETECFLNKIVRRLGSITSNITIDLRFHKDVKKKIVYVLIWAIDESIKDDIVVGL